MKKFKDIILSFFELTFKVILAPKAKVLFYYPQHFNRSAEGTNPFFDSLLETCERHGISYKLIEEPDWGTDKPRNINAIKGDALFVLILLLRKITGTLHINNSFYQNESVVARWVNIFTFGQLRCFTYITISGSMFHLLPNLKKDSNIYDMQHGILYKEHPTFFDQNNYKKLYPHFYSKKLHWLFWGNGYLECFLKGDEAILANKVHVIGYPIKKLSKSITPSNNSRTILFSLQFTADWDNTKLQRLKSAVISCISELQGTGCQVLLKHHPRYNNVIDISDIYTKYDFVTETKEPLCELAGKVMLHVTLHSTTAFEYAEYGIPSYFISYDDYTLDENLFYSDYDYPLYKGKTIKDVVGHLNNPDNYSFDSKLVNDWYKKFYSSYNENVLIGLINN